MENSNISERMSELLDLLNGLKREKGDSDVAFAVALMCMDSEEAQQEVIGYIRSNRETVSLEDVCRFLNTMFEPLETSDDDEDDVPA